MTEHSEVWRRIRRLSPKNNKRSWKKRQEFLGCDVRLFTPESSRCSASSLHLRRVPTLFQPHRWLLFARKKMKSYLRNSLRYRDFCDTTLKSISDRGRKRQRRALSAQGGGASVRYWFHPSPDPRDRHVFCFNINQTESLSRSSNAHVSTATLFLSLQTIGLLF